MRRIHAWTQPLTSPPTTSPCTFSPISPSGCTFWGKKPWSRKKKILWQLGTLVGAPVGIALIAGIAMPAMIIGIPVYVGRKVRASPDNTEAAFTLFSIRSFSRKPRSLSSDLQSLRGQGQLETQEEPVNSWRCDALCDCLSCDCSRNCR